MMSVLVTLGLCLDLITGPRKSGLGLAKWIRLQYRYSVRCAIVGGLDKTQCCDSNNVTGDCLDVCSGNIINFPTNVLVCYQYFNIYVSCFLQPSKVVPTAAGDLDYDYVIVII